MFNVMVLGSSLGATQAERPLLSKREKSVADLMREWRAVVGINTAAAGERLGLSPRTIEDIEQGRVRADDELSRLGLKKLLDDAK